jgi:hypothetical protein
MLRSQAVRDSGDTAPTVHVEVDTLTFDRVLVFLEAQALQRQLPGFAIHYLDDLQQVRLMATCTELLLCSGQHVLAHCSLRW